MARKVLYICAVVDGKITGIPTKDFQPADALDVFAEAVKTTMDIGTTKVGLTVEESEYNIYHTVDKVLAEFEKE